MQIYEIFQKTKEDILSGVDSSIKLRPPKAAPAPLPAATVNPLPQTPGYASTASNAPGWNYAGASAVPGVAVAAPAATPAATTPIGRQPDLSLSDRVKSTGGRLARGAAQAGRVAGAIGNALGSQILTKAGLPGDLGMGSKNPFGDKEAQARKAVEQSNKVQADQLYKQWAAAAQKTAPNTPAMQKSLDSIIANTLLRGRLPTDFGRYISQDKAQDVTAQLQRINAAKTALASKNAEMTYNDWANLVNATSELNHLLAFWPIKFSGVEMRKDGKFYANGVALNLQDPEDAQLLQTAMARQEVRMPANADINKVKQQVQTALQQQAPTK